jgi:hypothetical protein
LTNTTAPAKTNTTVPVIQTVAKVGTVTSTPMPTMPKYNPDVNALIQSGPVVSNVKFSNEYDYPIRPNQQATSVGSRGQDDVLTNEMKYSYTDYNTLPMYVNSGSFEYGYSFLPPEKWYPVPPNPPVCVTEKSCPVCPVYTEGSTVDLKEWNQSRRITPPDQINVNYVEEKLNSGR